MNTNPEAVGLAGSQVARPLNPESRGAETAALRNLVGFMNNPEISGAQIPSDADVEPPQSAGLDAVFIPPTPSPAQIAQAPVFLPQLSPAPAAPGVTPLSNRIFLTGRLASGKDYVAEQIGAQIIGFADPLYYLATYFFGIEVSSTKNKDVAGVRKFLQQVGQWGRADVDENYPLTVERATFTAMIRSMGQANCFDAQWKIDWLSFGLDPMLWVNGLLKRAESIPTTTRLVATNVRFQQEYDALSQAGWTHYHITCSPATWSNRLATKKLTPSSHALADKSEHMAAHCDEQVRKQISFAPTGPQMRAVWNDQHTPSPSPRLMTLLDFCQRAAI